MFEWRDTWGEKKNGLDMFELVVFNQIKGEKKISLGIGKLGKNVRIWDQYKSLFIGLNSYA